MKEIKVNDLSIAIIQEGGRDYISLTDMIKNMPNNNTIISNWLRKKDTLEYLSLWERLNNPNFKLLEFEEFIQNAGTNRFTISPMQWIDKTSAIGIISKSGRRGGTVAHKDIAFHFAMWLSPSFQLLIITEYQHLKEREQKQINPEWDYRRFLAKVNYHTHTDAIKENIIPVYQHITKEQEGYIYANEAEILNVAVFGKTSKEWRQQNTKSALEGKNIRDFANIPQLTVIANLESYNAILIKEGVSNKDRLIKLKETAVNQLKSLSNYAYKYPIESPYQTDQNKSSTFDSTLRGILDVPKPSKD